MMYHNGRRSNGCRQSVDKRTLLFKAPNAVADSPVFGVGELKALTADLKHVVVTKGDGSGDMIQAGYIRDGDPEHSGMIQAGYIWDGDPEHSRMIQAGYIRDGDPEHSRMIQAGYIRDGDPEHSRMIQTGYIRDGDPEQSHDPGWIHTGWRYGAQSHERCFHDAFRSVARLVATW